MTTQTTNHPTVERAEPAAAVPSGEAPQPSAAMSSGEALVRRRVLEALQAPPESLRLTYDEFLAWADEDTLAEWVDGEVIMNSPASLRHQEIGAFLVNVIGIYAEQKALGKVIPPPFQMKLEHGREPDLLFVAADHLGRLQATFLDGPADLVVEIISPESFTRDRGDKFTEYEAGGVPEYWLIDPQRRNAEFFRLEGTQFRLAFTGAAGEYHALTIPGFWLRVEWLWQDPLPAVEDVLLDIGGETYARRLIERLRQRGFLPGE